MVTINNMAETTAAAFQSESTLRISVTNAGPTKEVSIVRVDGVVDTITADELDRVISSLITRGRFRLVADLAGVEYISSAGWGIFVSYLREIREHGGDLKLARMTADVREIYELLEFDGLLPAYDRLEAAEAEFYRSTAAAIPVKPGRQDASSPDLSPPAAKQITAEKTARPGGATLDQTVLDLVAEDPFFTISEISRLLRQRCHDRFPAGWWGVFACLRRHHLLRRRARFRHFRQSRKNAA